MLAKKRGGEAALKGAILHEFTTVQQEAREYDDLSLSGATRPAPSLLMMIFGDTHYDSHSARSFLLFAPWTNTMEQGPQGHGQSRYSFK